MIINSEVVSINGGENQLICHFAQGSRKEGVMGKGVVTVVAVLYDIRVLC